MLGMVPSWAKALARACHHHQVCGPKEDQVENGPLGLRLSPGIPPGVYFATSLSSCRTIFLFLENRNHYRCLKPVCLDVSSVDMWIPAILGFG